MLLDVEVGLAAVALGSETEEVKFELPAELDEDVIEERSVADALGLDDVLSAEVLKELMTSDVELGFTAPSLVDEVADMKLELLVVESSAEDPLEDTKDGSTNTVV